MRMNSVRRHRAVDMILLMCVVGLAVVTSAAIPHAAQDVAWKYCFGVAVSMFLALAAVTPRDSWAISLRLATSGWLIAAPWLLAFADVSLARWAHLIAGSLIAVLTAPALFPRVASHPIKDAGTA
jgi:SPW repeat